MCRIEPNRTGNFVNRYTPNTANRELIILYSTIYTILLYYFYLCPPAVFTLSFSISWWWSEDPARGSQRSLKNTLHATRMLKSCQIQCLSVSIVKQWYFPKITVWKAVFYRGALSSRRVQLDATDSRHTYVPPPELKRATWLVRKYAGRPKWTFWLVFE